MNRYELTDFQWSVIEPLLSNKPCGAPRVDDWRVLNGIMWALRSSAPLAKLDGTLRALHLRLQPLRSLAQERHMGSPAAMSLCEIV